LCTPHTLEIIKKNSIGQIGKNCESQKYTTQMTLTEIVRLEKTQLHCSPYASLDQLKSCDMPQ